MNKIVRCVMAAEHLPAFVQGMTNLAAGMTVSESRELSPETQHTVSYRGIPYQIGGLSVTVDIVSDEGWVDDIIRKVAEAQSSDEFSVRYLYVLPIEASYHIRNGFMDL